MIAQKMLTKHLRKQQLNPVVSKLTSLMKQNKRMSSSSTSNVTQHKQNDNDDVLFETTENQCGIIKLNRPKALHALNLSMVTKIQPVLQKWYNQEKQLNLVLIRAAEFGSKAFCAGGDVKTIAVEGLKGNRKLGEDFFRKEYETNAIIGKFKAPYIAFIDGIVMGGGVGLSVHGKYRICTERTLFAMPETQIGLFPDVGGTYFLPRLPYRHLGRFLALTGHRLRGQDVLHAGIATHYCQSNLLPDLEKALIKKQEKTIDDVLKEFCKTKANATEKFSLEANLKDIEEGFGGETVEEIFVNLKKISNKKFGEENLSILNKMSPTSLKVTLKALKINEDGATRTLDECLKTEYRLACNCLRKHDFFEGVRALLIDKDQKPKWQPGQVSDVTVGLVDEHFTQPAELDELKHKL